MFVLPSASDEIWVDEVTIWLWWWQSFMLMLLLNDDDDDGDNYDSGGDDDDWWWWRLIITCDFYRLNVCLWICLMSARSQFWILHQVLPTTSRQLSPRLRILNMLRALRDLRVASEWMLIWQFFPATRWTCCKCKRCSLRLVVAQGFCFLARERLLKAWIAQNIVYYVVEERLCADRPWPG